MKAYPPISAVVSPLSFSYNSSDTGANRALGATESLEQFWTAVSMYYRFGKKIVDAGGMGFSYITPQANGGFTFTTQNRLFAMKGEDAANFMKPMHDALNEIGIQVNIASPLVPEPYGKRGKEPEENIANTRYRSRLFPRKNWADDKLWDETVGAIRKSLESGYRFHGIHYGPSLEVAGWPGSDSAVNPAWRDAVMHASLMSTQPTSLTPQQARDEETRIQGYMQLWRDVTPGSGAYMNEADPGEPNWQQSFFGNLYPRLLQIKKAQDPWGVFWAPTTVGSEGWEVRTADGYPRSQNGRLCRVKGG